MRQLSRKRNRRGGRRGNANGPVVPPGFWTSVAYPGNIGDVSAIGPDGKVHNLDLSEDRRHQHYNWNNQSNPLYPHFSNDIHPAGQRVLDWTTEVIDPTPAPWDGQPIQPLPTAIGGVNNRISLPTPPNHVLSNLRQLEIQELRLRGNQAAAQQGAPFVGGGGYECAWMFAGIIQSFSFGPAWDCFYYILSDLYITQPSITTLVSFVQEILNDVLNIGGGQIHGTDRVMVHFEGGTDVGSAAARVFLACANAAYQIGALSFDPLPLFHDIMIAFQSESMQDFLFYRLYVHILRNLGGGTLDGMPSNFLALRMSKSYGGRKGYKMISGGEDKACGLEALIWGMAGVLTKIKKRLKSLKEAIPNIYKKYDKFRERINTMSKKLLKTEIMWELAEMGEWKKGTDITHEQLGAAFNAYCDKYKLDIGLCIFNALIPLQKPYINYNPSEGVPKNIVCLVYWQFGVTGHYDCIDEVYVTSWILRKDEEKSGKRSSHAKFDFGNLKIGYKKDEEGLRCRLCKFWVKYQDKSKWDLFHDGIQGNNQFDCRDCGINFKSTKCYLNHKVIQHGNAKSACETNELCEKCDRIHEIKHDCDMFYCQVCMKSVLKSEKHACYIQFISKKKYGVVERVIYADLESKVDPTSRRQIAIICIAMYGDQCEEHEIPDHECKICKTVIKKFEGITCLTDFLVWLCEFQMGATVVFHNGGKYDLQLLCEQVAIDDGNLIISHEIPRGTQIVYLEMADKRHYTKRSPKLRFIDSLMFILMGLGDFSKAFGLKQNKGLFPYGILSMPGWEECKEVPGPSFFFITPKELKFLDKVKANNKNRGKHIQDVLDYIKEWEGKEWLAAEKLVTYCEDDVLVLMQGCNIFRKNFKKLVGIDPFKFPTLASAVAASHRQPGYMPDDSMQVFGVDTVVWMRSCLVGGRTEPFCLYVNCKPGWKIKYFDVRSEYPSVMVKRRYPIGKVTYDRDFGSFISFTRVCKDFEQKTGVRLYDVFTSKGGEFGLGLIECVVQTANDVDIPVLPMRAVPPGKKDKKLLYMIRTGVWNGYINLLATAIRHNQVIVLSIKKIMYWKETSTCLFKGWMSRLYAAKAMAGGWDKILGLDGKDKKEEIIKANADMGIIIRPEDVKQDKGLELTAKTVANCGWGRICMKLTSRTMVNYDNKNPEDVKKMGDALEQLGTRETHRRLVGKPTRVGNYTRISTTKDPADITTKEMDKNICYQAGGQVPAYGQQLLTETILSLNPDQIIYTDTDSVFYLVRDDHKDDKEIQGGVLLGDWVDEYPEAEIQKFACLGPKSYFMQIKHKDGKMEYKGKFKGIPIGSRSYSLEEEDGKLAKLGMDEMESFLDDAIFQDHEDKPFLEIKFKYKNSFSRNGKLQIVEKEEKKTLRVTFDKRKVVKPQGTQKLSDCHIIRTVPHNDYSSDLTRKDVISYWNSFKDRSYSIDVDVEEREGV